MKYAFIDYHNTDGTTKKLLGFIIDWHKLFQFLKNEWQCDKVFFYAGVDEGDLDMIAMLENLEKIGCTLRAKTVFAYKNKDREINLSCPSCQHLFIEHVDMGYTRKSNCDVELTVDAIENAAKDNEFYLFTGDGDFEFLIRNLVDKSVKVHVVSSGKKVKAGPRYSTSRLSTKLRNLFAELKNMVDFIDINNLKMRIKKD
ncbi:MAG: NYN domain-containing protein [bacterium]|nr:NYN domain-containing protein [bacterium]